MEHIVSVALDVTARKQLDDLRGADPNVPNRTQIILRVIWTSHAMSVGPAKGQPTLKSA